eukprot:4076631-Heterocapsa_arctica.AAC.1
MADSPHLKPWYGKLRLEEDFAKIRGTHFSAAYIDCSKCYERVDHVSAAAAAVKTGCNSTIVALAFDMYKTPRIVQ